MPEPNSKALREELHRLLDHLPQDDLVTARKLLRSLMDPVALSLLPVPRAKPPAGISRTSPRRTTAR